MGSLGLASGCPDDPGGRRAGVHSAVPVIHRRARREWLGRARDKLARRRLYDHALALVGKEEESVCHRLQEKRQGAMAPPRELGTRESPDLGSVADDIGFELQRPIFDRHPCAAQIYAPRAPFTKA